MIDARRAAVGLLLAAGLVEAAAADGLALGYVEAAAVRGDSRRSDGGRSEEGGVINLRIPLDDRWFLVGSAQRLDAYADGFGNDHAEEERRSFGIGARRGRDDNEMFARLVYTDISEWRYFNQPEGSGTALSVGGRKLFTPYLEGTIEGGLGIYNGSNSEDTASLVLNGQLALRLVPHLWAYAAYVTDDEGRMQFGLRVSFAHSRQRRAAPAVRAVEPGSGTLLAAGSSVIAKRALQLQGRPAFGAPETLVVPAGETVALVETRRNEFGNWWRVAWNGQQGWIREGWLLRAE
jgi:hypothetical protein